MFHFLQNSQKMKKIPFILFMLYCLLLTTLVLTSCQKRTGLHKSTFRCTSKKNVYLHSYYPEIDVLPISKISIK